MHTTQHGACIDELIIPGRHKFSNKLKEKLRKSENQEKSNKQKILLKNTPAINEQCEKPGNNNNEYINL